MIKKEFIFNKNKYKSFLATCIPPSPFKSGHIGFLVQKYAQCSETYQKQFLDFCGFYFLRNRQFCTQNT